MKSVHFLNCFMQCSMPLPYTYNNTFLHTPNSSGVFSVCYVCFRNAFLLGFLNESKNEASIFDQQRFLSNFLVRTKILPELYLVYAVNLDRIFRNHCPNNKVRINWNSKQFHKLNRTKERAKIDYLLCVDQIDIRKAHWIVLSYPVDRYRHSLNVVGMILLCIVVNHFRMIRMENIDVIRGHFSLIKVHHTPPCQKRCRNNDWETKINY